MQTLYIHPDNPQERLIQQAIRLLRDDGLMVIPTDLGYVFGATVSSRSALDKLKKIRNLDDKHHFTLLCQDLSQVSGFAVVNNEQFRHLKAHTPAPITFILSANKDTPKKLAHPKKKTIGIRIANTPIITALLDVLTEPLLISSLILPDVGVLYEPYLIQETLDHVVDGFIDVGILTDGMTSVVDLTDNEPVCLRKGAVDVSDWAIGPL